MKNSQNALLLLADGTLFKGYSFGKKGISYGEICFNTGMTGYQEVFTDPSYYGQVLVMNTAHIGNYGINTTDIESNSVKIAGLVAKNLSDSFSRTLATSDLEQYLIDNNIIAIHGIDTRALVTHIRKAGSMNCILSSTEFDLDILKEKLQAAPNIEGSDLTNFVSTKESYFVGQENSPIRIAVLDFGIKKSMLRLLEQKGAYLNVFPNTSTIEELNAFEPDAYFISNGPGDPASMHHAINTVKAIIQTEKPCFGICLGHQLICLSQGATSFKMHYGHRGLNHPVFNIKTQKSEITTQNHGFAIDKNSIEPLADVEITHVNLNDQTLEGIQLKSKPVFSVQYHPESTPGPHDSRYLFDQFFDTIKQFQTV
ncbi:MAG: glutamine-hydrolyzing carbamoyl-phosphate synthase small subunit [Chitinophagaceae bacterium]